MAAPGTLVILRHGQSTWNLENLFTGWHDVPLTPQGEQEARAAGRTMAEAGLLLRHVAHVGADPGRRHAHPRPRRDGSGVAARCSGTGGSTNATTARCKGSTSGQTTERHGAEQTFLWRRSFDVPPPPLAPDDPEHPAHDRATDCSRPTCCPRPSACATSSPRVLPYWHDVIAPQLLAGLDVLVTAHGNSLRALLMHLEGVPPEEIPAVNIPTGVPRRYEFDDRLPRALGRVPRRRRGDRRGRRGGRPAGGHVTTVRRRRRATPRVRRWPARRHTSTTCATCPCSPAARGRSSSASPARATRSR